MKTDIIAIQKHVGVEPDGIIGPRTVRAIHDKLGLPRVPTWPTQAEVRRGTSIFGRAGCEADLVPLTPPYPLYYEGKAVRSIRVHRLIAKHVQEALAEVLAAYGQETIRRLGLDVYGGSYNYRSTSSGAALSMHAWGIALDFSPSANALHYKAPRASLSHPDCNKWWEIWERHGAVSLGRECDYDWMHLQFARLQ
ncbi:MAG: hypothetical protein IKV92_05465 [Akkermansia sp.]|nr:hypothetical protein [Akkermansia sp.]